MDLSKIKEQVVEAAIKALHENVLPAIEIEVEKQINLKSDAIVGLALAKIAELIPGKFDDIMIAQYSESLKAGVKGILLAEAEKISDKV